MSRGFKWNKRVRVYLRHGGKCAYCGIKLTFSDFTIDHIKPICHGGRGEYRNLALCCKGCNQTKGSTKVDMFIKNKEKTDWMKENGY